MDELCWLCELEHGVNKDEIGNCQYCFADIDCVPYQPLVYEDINQPNQKGDLDMIPQKKDSVQFEEFIKLPNPLKNQEGEIKTGDSVKILTEFTEPNNPKISSALLGIVEINGQKRTVGLNWTSYYTIAKVYGKDTTTWISKEITYRGLTQFEKGTGHLWTAKS